MYIGVYTHIYILWIFSDSGSAIGETIPRQIPMIGEEPIYRVYCYC